MLGVFTILAILLLVDGRDPGYAGTLEVGATYEGGEARITFSDKSGEARGAVMEVLGLPETFQRSYVGYEFEDIVPFAGTPANGWAAHPVVILVDHPTLGEVQVKTEIRPAGEPAAPVLYSKP